MTDKKKTILIVEDEAPMLSALVDKFKKEKINVLDANNGEDGLAIALKEHPDIILLDVIMPKMDGMSLMRELRNDDWGRDVDVVMLTNLSDPMQVAEAAKVGVYDFLVKTDWRLDDVVGMVFNRLDNQPDEEEEEE